MARNGDFMYQEKKSGWIKHLDFTILDLRMQELAFRPGLTGMWQVSGRSDITDFEEIVKMDTQYIANWTLGLDIKIILKTIVVVFTGKGSK